MADMRITGEDRALVAAGSPGRTLRAEFTGTAGEYFRIWIVNLFFSLATLGVYSAWAKVRKKKYFYGSTRVDGESFDYYARPAAILKGRVVAFLALVIYAFVGELYPQSRYAFWALAVLLMPWLVVRALTFNARNSAHRGLRFHFSGTPNQAARIYIGLLAVTVLTAGLAFPWFMARQKAFAAERHAFGLTRLGCDLSTRAFFGVYFRAGLILLGLGVPLVWSTFALTPFLRAESYAWLAWLLPAVGMYASYAVAYAYIQARTTNLLWNSIHGPGFRFSSSLAALKLLRIYVGNILAVACSAGLLIPWAVVRTLRYRLENLAMIVEKESVHEANPALARVGATGQELGDFFNLDLGI
jgi:uncharacterized membrane protein YjgN (DUF898 family)